MPISKLVQSRLLNSTDKTWLITGVAGFIGCNILEVLLRNGQKVIGLDNFSTGYQRNLERVQINIGCTGWRNFEFIEGDIRDEDICSFACRSVDYVLHQAALGSVPRSIENPSATNEVNISGFLNILNAAKDQSVSSFTYASSSSVYGNLEYSPKVEHQTGEPLSPYALTKAVNEMYSSVFEKTYGFKSIGLRYFNVFGPGQDPAGAYAAVIPSWTRAMINDQELFINGDGTTSRDFCYIDNVVEANILAATSKISNSDYYNVALCSQASLNELFDLLKNELRKHGIIYAKEPIYRNFRPGDVKHSLADIKKIKRCLGYEANYSLAEGLGVAMPWYIDFIC